MEELKRGLWNRRMLLAVLIAVVVMGRTFWQYQLFGSDYDVLYLLTYPMGLSGFVPFACIFPLFPYALSFEEEYNQGYLRFVLMRMSRKRYMVRKILVTALSGGAMMVLAFGIIFGAAVFAGVPTTKENLSGAYAMTVWNSIAAIGGGKLVIFLKLLLAFLFGCVWSSVGLLVSVIFTNRYVAFMVPFLLYQLLWNLLSGSMWNPVYLLRADANYPSFFTPMWMQGMCLLGLFLITWFLMRRKLKNV